MPRSIPLVLALASVAVLASNASAGIDVGAVSVFHTIYHQHPTPPDVQTVTTQTLNSSTTNGTFDTYDGKTGATAAIGPAGGTFKVYTYGINSLAQTNPGYTFGTTSGTLDFSVHGGTVVPSLDRTVENAGYGSFTFTITQPSTGLFWLQTYAPAFTPPTTTGSLPLPLTPGDYQLAWDTTQFYMVGTTRGGDATLNLAFVPEPATMAALGLLPVLARRRR